MIVTQPRDDSLFGCTSVNLLGRDDLLVRIIAVDDIRTSVKGEDFARRDKSVSRGESRGNVVD